MTKSENNKNRKRKRNSGQTKRKYFNDIIEKNFANLNRDAYQCTKSTQTTKYTGPEKKVSLTHNNQNTNLTKWGKNIKSLKGKRP